MAAVKQNPWNILLETFQSALIDAIGSKFTTEEEYAELGMPERINGQWGLPQALAPVPESAQLLTCPVTVQLESGPEQGSILLVVGGVARDDLKIEPIWNDVMKSVKAELEMRRITTPPVFGTLIAQTPPAVKNKTIWIPMKISQTWIALGIAT